MKNTKISIIYTSDVHGKLASFDFINQNDHTPSLSGLSTYMKNLHSPYILIDNGDSLQGSPLLDYSRSHDLPNPVATSMNLLNYDFYTLGNHDFNYGFSYLESYIKQNKATLLCCNILDESKKPYFKPYEIKHIDGIKIGFIGALTAYVPIWEKPEHIKGLSFQSAFEQVSIYVDQIKAQVDAIVVLYHGGYENDLNTGKPVGRPSIENEGYKIFNIPGVDVLLCGHQHQPTIYKKDMKSTIQTAQQVFNFGQIDLTFDKHHKLIDNHPMLIKNDFEKDISFESHFDDLVKKTDQNLDLLVGEVAEDMKFNDQFLDRLNNHPFFELINIIQKSVTHADISVASLPNQALGLSKKITKRELAANFIYVNSLVKMEITGKILRDALERNSYYFDIDHDQIVMSDAYIHPKLEHYNFDIYSGIEYTYKISNPIGHRLVNLKFNGKTVKDDDTFTICLNSYRANGGGDYFMFTKGKIIEDFDISYVDLITSYIKKHPHLKMVFNNQFKVII